jgi:hypothetical protein
MGRGVEGRAGVAKHCVDDEEEGRAREHSCVRPARVLCATSKSPRERRRTLLCDQQEPKGDCRDCVDATCAVCSKELNPKRQALNAKP